MMLMEEAGCCMFYLKGSPAPPCSQKYLGVGGKEGTGGEGFKCFSGCDASGQFLS